VGKKVEFIISNEISTPYRLKGDALRIKQVLINLISNAFKFTEKGSVNLTLKQINSSAEKTDIRFNVTDTGIGMTADQLENIFQAFQQGDSSITRKYGGTGLGLNICYKFIELMGGKLKVKSEFNKGTSFYFTLPLGIDKELELPEVKSESELSSTNANILLAEDEMLNQFIFRRILEDEGFNITIVSNGLECINALKRENNFDLILMDIQMPEMDGIAATQYIRTVMENKEIIIIALSANALTDTKEQILSVGMNDFIPKPVNVNELFVVMTKWIRQRKQIRM
jgi:CheY-like chemotaxis protein